MKRTLDIESELYAVAESLAQSQQKNVGQVVSELLRRALGLAPESVNVGLADMERSKGFDVFPVRTAPKATVEEVNRIYREESV